MTTGREFERLVQAVIPEIADYLPGHGDGWEREVRACAQRCVAAVLAELEVLSRDDDKRAVCELTHDEIRAVLGRLDESLYREPQLLASARVKLQQRLTEKESA